MEHASDKKPKAIDSDLLQKLPREIRASIYFYLNEIDFLKLSLVAKFYFEELKDSIKNLGILKFKRDFSYLSEYIDQVDKESMSVRQIQQMYQLQECKQRQKLTSFEMEILKAAHYHERMIKKLYEDYKDDSSKRDALFQKYKQSDTKFNKVYSLITGELEIRHRWERYSLARNAFTYNLIDYLSYYEYFNTVYLLYREIEKKFLTSYEPVIPLGFGWNIRMHRREELFPLSNNLDYKDNSDRGVTPLILAIELNNEKAFSLLLHHKASPNITDNFGNTPLHTVARFGRTKYLEKLLSDSRLEVNYLNTKGKTALTCAVGKGHLEFLNELFTQMDPNSLNLNLGGILPLHLSVKNNYPTISLTLMEHKADPNLRDKKGRTALYYACKFERTQMMAKLESRANDPYSIKLNYKIDSFLTSFKKKVEAILNPVPYFSKEDIKNTYIKSVSEAIKLVKEVVSSGRNRHRFFAFSYELYLYKFNAIICGQIQNEKEIFDELAHQALELQTKYRSTLSPRVKNICELIIKLHDSLNAGNAENVTSIAFKHRIDNSA